MPLFFAFTLFVSASLLFLIQPMVARMLLPKLGGTPQVWNTCMVFFQAILLVGYGYAHLTTRWWGARQVWVHLGLLASPLALWALMPFGVPKEWEPSEGASPVLWLLGTLFVTAGLPFFVVSTSAPLLQKWFADTGHPSGRDPYFLYAASNVGSMLALFSYPALVEPALTLEQQGLWWAAGYAALAVLIALCGFLLLRSRREDIQESQPAASKPTPLVTAPSWRDRLNWVALAFVPSSLLLGVTTYLTTDIAAFPWLWVLPLALYLLTFILAFSAAGSSLERILIPVTPFVVLVFLFQQFAGYAHVSTNPGVQTVWLIGYSLGTFYLLAQVCHSRLAALRPTSTHLTEFYLWMSLGGVLGGLFNALLAPVLFTTTAELPLALLGVCLLYRPQPKEDAEPRSLGIDLGWAVAVAAVSFVLLSVGNTDAFHDYFKDPDHTRTRLARGALYVVPILLCYVACLSRRPSRFGLCVAALVVAALWTQGRGNVVFRGRSFFGIVTVNQDSEFTRFLHGTTWHGMQSRKAEERQLPLTYFHREGPMGDIMAVWHARRGPQKLGITGLGAGTLACYGREGDRITFYEIDPLVEYVARNPAWFTYLSDAKERGVGVHVVVGDGRLRMREAGAGEYGMIILDAFSSDAVPVHLLTREALALYLEKLADDGVLVFNVSNRHLDLRPVLYHLAQDAGLVGRYCADSPSGDDPRHFASTWAVLARREADLGKLATEASWKPLADKPGTSLWTDSFSNLFRVVYWW